MKYGLQTKQNMEIRTNKIMKKRNSIHSLFSNELYFRGFLLKFASGKEVPLKLANLKERTENNAWIFHADLEEYVAEFYFCEIEEKIISCKTFYIRSC